MVNFVSPNLFPTTNLSLQMWDKRILSQQGWMLAHLKNWAGYQGSKGGVRRESSWQSISNLIYIEFGNRNPITFIPTSGIQGSLHVDPLKISDFFGLGLFGSQKFAIWGPPEQLPWTPFRRWASIFALTQCVTIKSYGPMVLHKHHTQAVARRITLNDKGFVKVGHG